MEAQHSPSLKVNDSGYVKFNGRWCRYTISNIHEELGGSLSIFNGVGSATCAISDFIPERQFDAQKMKDEEPEARRRLAPILEAWEAGHKTHNAICAYLAKKDPPVHIHFLAISSKMRECHRRGFIQLPIVDNLPSTNTNPTDTKTSTAS